MSIIRQERSRTQRSLEKQEIDYSRILLISNNKMRESRQVNRSGDAIVVLKTGPNNADNKQRYKV